MLTFHRARLDDYWLEERGVWRPGWTELHRTATVTCPLCGQRMSLSKHRIDAAGNVQPSLRCPRGNCDFHDFVALEDWGD